MNYSELIKFIKLVGLNPHLISKLLKEPLNNVYSLLLSLFHEYQISVFPILNTEKLGLWKAVIWCEKSVITYSKAKKLAGPLANIFRGDIEDNSFLLIFYTNPTVFEEAKTNYEEIFKKLNMDCSVNLVLQSFRFINDENCYNFDVRKWICNRKDVYISVPSRKFINLDKKDVDLLTSIQVNPSIPYWRNLHYKHIKATLHGFMYTLGKTNYIIDIKSRKIVDNPYLVWSAQLDNGEYLAEYHTDKENLKNILDKNTGEIILAVKDLNYAHGFSIPFEIFKDNKWKIPKIKIE
ncbi:hypothetical protein [Stygiolobus caldivivus]|uniref:Uncharacterized protein n=1 Tax=Stygiolobus caldivivus TaxID=2824673 RepID=A0A8D5U5H9_9CREN|nr:hypothetical protein [Stygiolobus caldivivus]BCU69261.1 hypothetical protein KN1_05580 [Stygiolobus caldivivus]